MAFGCTTLSNVTGSVMTSVALSAIASAFSQTDDRMLMVSLPSGLRLWPMPIVSGCPTGTALYEVGLLSLSFSCRSLRWSPSKFAFSGFG